MTVSDVRPTVSDVDAAAATRDAFSFSSPDPRANASTTSIARVAASVRAHILGVRPRASIAHAPSGHARPTASTHAPSPLAHALCNAVSPSTSLARASPPAATSARAHIACPPAHALCSAVARPLTVVAVTSNPRSSNASTHASDPARAA